MSFLQQFPLLPPCYDLFDEPLALLIVLFSQGGTRHLQYVAATDISGRPARCCSSGQVEETATVTRINRLYTQRYNTTKHGPDICFQCRGIPIAMDSEPAESSPGARTYRDCPGAEPQHESKQLAPRQYDATSGFAIARELITSCARVLGGHAGKYIGTPEQFVPA